MSVLREQVILIIIIIIIIIYLLPPLTPQNQDAEKIDIITLPKINS